MTTAWKARKKKVKRCQGCRDDSSMATRQSNTQKAQKLTLLPAKT